MTFEITERDFLNIVNKPHCIGKEKRNGTAKDGHPDCKHCKGNYFVGGQCNFGAEHLLEEDLRKINYKFKKFGALLARQSEISSSKSEKTFNERKQKLIDQFKELETECDDDNYNKFFTGTCVGIDDSQIVLAKKIKKIFRAIVSSLKDYREQVEKSTWEQVQAFTLKLEELTKMEGELNRTTEKWKNETDPAKKRQLFALIKKQQTAIANFKLEMKNDPGYKLFSEERGEEIKNIIKNAFSGEETLFNLGNNKKNKNQTQVEEKYFGFIPKKWGKRILWGGVILAIFFLAYRWIRKKTG